jgi:CheY-like chemotaxis protein/HPt (histidine-containing phosphotransfer) domain-containing protein
MMAAKELNKEIDDTSLQNKKILLAEDIKLNQFIAKQLLESWGCEVVIANNGKEALQLLQQNVFDCILMDVQMPELDGVAATELIRKLPDPIKANVPVIALTANVRISDKEKYIKAGMNDCIGKPVDEYKLFAAISNNLVNDYKAGTNINIPEPINEQTETDKKLYDLTMIHSVSGGDASFIKKMVLLFIETVPQNVAELKKSAEAENWDQAAKLAHKLKSTIDSMGIKSIHQEIRLVEANAKQKANLAEMPSLIQKIGSVIANCVEQLHVEIG